MGRREVFDRGRILDAALHVLARQGAQRLSVAAVARELGAPSGSIYHRFPSRDLLLAALWIRSVRRFQDGYREALGAEEPRTALRLAVEHVLRWSEAHREEAALLMRYGRSELLARWPDELGEELTCLDDDVVSALAAWAGRAAGPGPALHPDAVRFAAVTIPEAAVVQHLRSGTPGPWPTEFAVAASLAVLEEEGRGIPRPGSVRASHRAASPRSRSPGGT